MTKYFICGGGYTYWQETNAHTIAGAKMRASKAYQQCVGGKIEVAVAIEHGPDSEYSETGREYYRVAVKHGFDAWVDNP